MCRNTYVFLMENLRLQQGATASTRMGVKVIGSCNTQVKSTTYGARVCVCMRACVSACVQRLLNRPV
jgi:hypothetical protein